MTVFMFSLMGIPPLFGFFGKVFAFLPAIQADLWWLVVTALIASVIGAFYYLRVIKTMWFDEPTVEFIDAPASLRYITTGVALILGLLVFFGVFTLPFRDLLESASLALTS